MTDNTPIVATITEYADGYAYEWYCDDLGAWHTIDHLTPNHPPTALCTPTCNKPRTT